MNKRCHNAALFSNSTVLSARPVWCNIYTLSNRCVCKTCCMPNREDLLIGHNGVIEQTGAKH